jgi:superfamily II DNA/RNA helicase
MAYARSFDSLLSRRFAYWATWLFEPNDLRTGLGRTQLETEIMPTRPMRSSHSSSSRPGPGRRPNRSQGPGGQGGQRTVSVNVNAAPGGNQGKDLFSQYSPGAPIDPNATFAELKLDDRLLRQLEVQGIGAPFPIQAATIGDCLSGKDVLGRAKTGSGKTLAFSLPMLSALAATKPQQRQAGRPRALILAPTRELVVQIQTVMAPYANALGLTTTTVFGGVGANPQIRALRAGVDIVIACPGRLLDHIGEGFCNLDRIEITVLDEADHMADMGFLPDVTRILDRTPRDSQRLLFSATLDNGIDALVRKYLRDPILRSVDPVEADQPKMTHHVFDMGAEDRLAVLKDLGAAPGRILVFTRTKHGAKKLAKTLTHGGVPAVEMHGNLSQNARIRNLEAFRDGSAPTMVATDVAARGIHVDDVALVIHYDPPVDHKAYLHRSGRTARAGAEGIVVTFMSQGQQSEVRALTKLAGISPTTTKVGPNHALLRELAPGERTYLSTAEAERRLPQAAPPAAQPRVGSRARAANARANAPVERPNRPNTEARPARTTDAPREARYGRGVNSQDPSGRRSSAGRPAETRPTTGRPADPRRADSRSEGRAESRPVRDGQGSRAATPASGRPGRPAARPAGSGERSHPNPSARWR